MNPLVIGPPVIVTRFTCNGSGARQVIDLGSVEGLYWFQAINPAFVMDLVFDRRSGISAATGYRVRSKGLMVQVSRATRYVTAWTLQGTHVAAAIYRIGQTELHT